MRQSQPLFHSPRVVVAVLFSITALHFLRHFLSDETNLRLLLNLAFIPARYVLPDDADGVSALAKYWTPLTYAFLHADAAHLMVNALWMSVFGSAVGWRFGALRFLGFCAICTMAAAGLHYTVHRGDIVALVGASGAISGLTAAAALFMFEPGGSLSADRYAGKMAFLVPARGARVIFQDKRVFGFIAIWFALNLLFGIGGFPAANGENAIAWEAHMGGFLAGLIFFAFFDPVPRNPLALIKIYDNDQKIDTHDSSQPIEPTPSQREE